jgi:nucleoside-diphosphate-sugar epimerase
VIGGSGFIGTPLVKQLIGSGHEVAIFHRGQTPGELPPDVVQIRGDRAHLEEHAADFRDFRPQVIVDVVAYFERHARGLVQTFRGLADRLEILSSGDVYRAFGRLLGTEPGPAEAVPLSEDAPLRETFYPYRMKATGPDDLTFLYDKILVERAVMGHPDILATVLRLPMVYGPGDKQHRLYQYLKRMDDRRPAILLDHDFARWRSPRGFVDNVAAAIILAVTNDRAAGRI